MVKIYLDAISGNIVEFRIEEFQLSTSRKVFKYCSIYVNNNQETDMRTRAELFANSELFYIGVL